MEREEILSSYCKGVELYNNGSYKEAFQQIYCAADHGFLPAVTLLCDMYFNGFGVEKDKHTALEYYCYAAEHDEPTALCRAVTEWNSQNDGKPWKYVLLAHSEVHRQSSFKYLMNAGSNFEQMTL